MKLTIWHDDCPENPRDWSESNMVCWHRRYNLGDAHAYADPEDFIRGKAQDFDPEFDDFEYHQENVVWNDLVDHGKDIDEANRIIDNVVMTHAEKIVRANCVMLPVFMYEHSGVALNTGGFSCSWDSGRVGYIYYTNRQVCELFNGNRELAKQALEMEVATYGEYINGDCYGFTVEDDNGEVIDSCGGFIGADHYTNGIRDAVMAIENLVREYESALARPPE